LLAYGPLLPWLGFYRDDWYQLWAGTTLGPRSIITLFSIDRPVMGYFYAAAFSVRNDSALAWQICALFLRWLGPWAHCGSSGNCGRATLDHDLGGAAFLVCGIQQRQMQHLLEPPARLCRRDLVSGGRRIAGRPFRPALHLVAPLPAVSSAG
jgi:hypothetical protein